MAEITFETSVEQQPSGIGVPEVVRWKVERERRHTQRITIDAKDAKGKFGKINGFKLDTAKGNDGYPTQEVDEICEAIMWCVLQAFLERAAQQKDPVEELEFRITFDQRLPDGSRKRPSTEFTYNPDQPDTNRPMSSDEDGRMRGEVLTQLLDLIRALTAHLDNAHLRIIESNKGSEAILKPIEGMFNLMTSTYTAGIEMQRRAMDYMYSTKRIEEEALAADRRQERLLKFAEKPFKIALAQFAKYAGKKFQAAGIDPKDIAEDETSDDVPSAAPGEGGEPHGAQPQPEPEPEIQHAGATLLATFGMLIGPAQWQKITSTLTKAEMATFTSLFDAATDAEALERWQKIEHGGIALKKLLVLKEILNPEQAHMFEQVAKVMEIIDERGCGEDGAMLPDEKQSA